LYGGRTTVVAIGVGVIVGVASAMVYLNRASPALLAVAPRLGVGQIVCAVLAARLHRGSQWHGAAVGIIAGTVLAELGDYVVHLARGQGINPGAVVASMLGRLAIAVLAILFFRLLLPKLPQPHATG